MAANNGVSIEELKAQYQKLTEDFKKNATLFLESASKQGVESLQKQTDAAWEQLATTYSKGSADIRNQILASNKQLIEKFESNYKQLQQGVEDAYKNDFAKNQLGQFQNNMQKFTEQTNGLVNNLPASVKSNVEPTIAEAKKYLTQKQNEISTAVENKEKQVLQGLKQSHDDTVKKLTVKIEDLTPKKKSK